MPDRLCQVLHNRLTNHLAHEGRLREIDLEAGASAVPAGGVMIRTRAELGLPWLVIPQDAR